MSICKTCRHFNPYVPADFYAHGPSRGKCDSDAFEEYEGPSKRTDSLLYWDYESYSAGFDVGEDFGCIHWVVA